MDIRKSGCRKSTKKPAILWLLEWERANNEVKKEWVVAKCGDNTRKGRRKKFKMGRLHHMQPIPCNCICLSITIQKAADN